MQDEVGMGIDVLASARLSPSGSGIMISSVTANLEFILGTLNSAGSEKLRVIVSHSKSTASRFFCYSRLVGVALVFLLLPVHLYGLAIPTGLFAAQSVDLKQA